MSAFLFFFQIYSIWVSVSVIKLVFFFHFFHSQPFPSLSAFGLYSSGEFSKKKKRKVNQGNSQASFNLQPLYQNCNYRTHPPSLSLSLSHTHRALLLPSPLSCFTLCDCGSPVSMPPIDHVPGRMAITLESEVQSPPGHN